LADVEVGVDLWAGVSAVSALFLSGITGHMDWGKVARRAAAGSVGRYRLPVWPQPVMPSKALAAMTASAVWLSGLTRIRGVSNITEL
jgi:hypothetical protein